MEPFQEGEWVILHQLNKKKLARIGRKGFTTLGKDFVSLEGAIGCLPWTNFKMEPQTGSKSSKRVFKVVPLDDDDDEYSELDPHDLDQDDKNEEDRDNRTINDDGQSQGLTAIEIEALREGGLTGKEIVNHLVANSTTYDKKTRYAKSKYLKKKESKHCLREKLSIRRTTLSSVAEVLCSGGGGEGSRGSISGMRPDTLSQMLTALNVQWKRITTTKPTSPKQINPDVESGDKSSVCKNNESKEASLSAGSGSSIVESSENKDGDSVSLEVGKVLEVETKNVVLPALESDSQPGTTYVVYESGNWGLLVASLLTLLPSGDPRLIHLYPGHGVPCLIAPRALNLPQDKLSILSSVNFKALLEKLKEKSGNTINMDEVAVKMEISEDQFSDCEENSETLVDNVCDVIEEGITAAQRENSVSSEVNQEVSSSVNELSEALNENRKRKIEGGEETHENESSLKKPRWQLEAEYAADLLTSRKADGLVVIAAREHPVSIVLSLLPYLAPSRPLVVYCPHREPLLDLYAVLKGWEPWTTKYIRCGSKGVSRVANLRVVENWLRNYQVLPNRTHPEVNMTPGGGFVLTGTVIDFSDD